MSDFFNDLMTSAKQAVAISHDELKAGRVTEIAIPDVKEIRKKTGYKQKDFALLVGVSLSLVEAWEQHRRILSGSSLKLLVMIDRYPSLINELSGI
ncbi:XRE family transcriptional regulator [Yersinia massiliensis]|uniref:NadS family protein n=1 Tax=Yersinia massiliensis TaxID=419257 RepID=UPI0005DFFADB|nr:NadS family protein [Yersinia massiliensis]CNI52133.1 XRE family transcriptional regulator [Yersinia massiliensis]